MKASTIIALLLTTVLGAHALQPAPDNKATAPLAVSLHVNKGAKVAEPKFDHDGYKKDWHEEWRQGDYPHWKETVRGLKEDKSEKSKKSQKESSKLLLSAVPGANAAHPKLVDKSVAPSAVNLNVKSGATLAEPKFDHEGYKKDWHEEWRQGDYPHWKETVRGLKGEKPEKPKKSDKESSKLLLSAVSGAKPVGKPAAPSAVNLNVKSGVAVAEPKFDHEGYKKDWHEEWRQGDYPHWKETVRGLKEEKPKKSDKEGSKLLLSAVSGANVVQPKPVGKQAAPPAVNLNVKSGATVAEPKFDHEGYKKDWHEEWRQGDYPHWKETVRGLKEEKPKKSDKESSKLLLSAVSGANGVQPKPVGKPAAPSAVNLNVKSGATVAEPKFDHEGYKKDWHEEWRQGDYPHWKETVRGLKDETSKKSDKESSKKK